MSGLKVRRLDSPLARAQPVPASQEPGMPEVATATPAPAPAAAPAGDPSVGERPLHVARAPRSPSKMRETDGTLARPEPPALDESLELLSTRLPSSLRRSLNELTAALRARNGLVSQKGLPEQEVLALLIWAAGSPDDPVAVERLDELLSEFRARRYAAAALALQS